MSKFTRVAVGFLLTWSSTVGAQSPLAQDGNVMVVSYSSTLGVLVDAAYRMKPGTGTYATAKVTLSARAREQRRTCKAKTFEFLRWESPFPMKSLGRNEDYRATHAKLLADARRAGWTVTAGKLSGIRQHFTFKRGETEMFALITPPQDFPNVYEVYLCRTR